MRLININTLEQREFADPPPYAILSHRWTHDKLAFKDYHKLHDLDTVGADKFKEFCALLREIYNTPPGRTEDLETRHPIHDPQDDLPFDEPNIDEWMDGLASVSSHDLEESRREYEYREAPSSCVMDSDLPSSSHQAQANDESDGTGSARSFYDSGDIDSSTRRMSDGAAVNIKAGLPTGNGRMVKWAWIDTCCIDKASSSELSEAINSMWMWYRRAELCVVYLGDVSQSSNRLASNTAVRSPILEPVEPQSGTDQATCNVAASDSDTFLQLEIRHSEWFSRGWTLQQLLAPDEVMFCNQYWHAIGRKKEVNFCRIIESASGVPMRHLMDPWTILHASVAQRMSWASRRVTTRDEDMGYCLLGLFNVNMPLIYGEGKKAFLRLQEEIIRQSDDESILAWTYTPIQPLDGSDLKPLLATHPRDFRHSQDIYRIDFKTRQPYSITNKGLLFVADAIYIEYCGIYVVQLNCAEGHLTIVTDIEAFTERRKRESASRHTTPCLIALKEVRKGSFARVDCNSMDLSSLENNSGFISALQRRGRHSVNNKHFLLETRDAKSGWIQTQDSMLLTGRKVHDFVPRPPTQLSQWLFGDSGDTT